MIILGLESSCDETSVAILQDEKILSNIIASQHFHLKYGGVVPELSSRAHLQMIAPLYKQAIEQAGISKEDIDVVAATAGPGLIGALLVGLNFGKALAYSLNKPFVAVNHIEGHIFSGFLMNEKPEFPYLCLVASGGHTLLLLIKDDLNITKLGSTIDDAAGEAFDKVAKMLGLGYPGGPKIQEFAKRGNANKIKFPVANLKSQYDFSFSGLKTSVLRYVQKEYGTPENIPEEDKPDIAASFQDAVVRALGKNVEKGLKNFEAKSLSLVGGVAANNAIRTKFKELSKKYNKKLVIPAVEFCGDNGAMIAYRGAKLFENNIIAGLTANAFPALPKNIFKTL